MEAYALDRSTRYQVSHVPTGQEAANIKLDKTSKIRNFIEPGNHQYFFYNNKLIRPIYSLGKNFRFEFLNEVDMRTPVYSKKPEMLFYVDDVEFNKIIASQEYIDMMANNIKVLRDTLKEKYNIELIYYIQPTKYSIYGKYTENFTEYNNFIPMAYNSLIKHGINTFDVYTEYNMLENIGNDLLYYKGDSHFTPRGKDVVVNNILRFIR